MKPKPKRGLCPILSTVYGDVEVNNLDVGEACYSKFAMLCGCIQNGSGRAKCRLPFEAMRLKQKSGRVSAHKPCPEKQ